MYMKIQPREGFWLATVAGRVSLNTAIELGKAIYDAAAERGFGKILIDCLGVEGELSVVDRYELGEQIAEYCKNQPAIPALALLGALPTVTGFCALVARHRGVLVETFSERQPAVGWLHKFGFKGCGAMKQS